MPHSFLKAFLQASLCIVLLCASPLSAQQQEKISGEDQWKEKVQKHQDQKKLNQMLGLSEIYKEVTLYEDLWEKLYEEKEFKTVEQRLTTQFNNMKTPLEKKYYSDTIESLSAESYRKEHHERHTILNDWVKASPNSHLPYLVRGNFYINYAWFYRGTSYSNLVTDEGLKKMGYYMNLAQADLEKAYEINPIDPESMHNLMSVAVGLGYGNEAFEHCYQKVMEINPLHYNARSSKMNFIQPKWGGSWEAMEALMDENEKLSAEFPLLLLINRFATQGMISRGTKYENAWDNNHKKWFQAAYDQLALNPDDLLIQSDVIYLAMNAKEYQIAHDLFEKIGNQYLLNSRYDSLERYSGNRAFCFYHFSQKPDVKGTPREEELLLKALAVAPKDDAILGIYRNILDIKFKKDPSNQKLKEELDLYGDKYLEAYLLNKNGIDYKPILTKKKDETPAVFRKINSTLITQKKTAQRSHSNNKDNQLYDHYTTFSLLDDSRGLLYINKDFDAIQKRINTLRENATTLFDHYYYSEYIEFLGYYDYNQDTQELLATLNEWIEHTPDSHLPYLVRGYLYLNLSRLFVSSSTSIKIPFKPNEEFLSLSKLAQADFQKSYDLNPSDPNSSVGLLTTGGHLAIERPLIDTYFQQALKASPLHFRAHLQRMNCALPLWGGSWEEMDDFEAICKAKTKDSPMLNYVLRFSYQNMEQRNQNYYKRSQEARILWAQTALQLSEKYPNNPILHYHFIHLANSVWELKDQSTKYLALINNQYPEDMWHFDISVSHISVMLHP